MNILWSKITVETPIITGLVTVHYVYNMLCFFALNKVLIGQMLINQCIMPCTLELLGSHSPASI